MNSGNTRIDVLFLRVVAATLAYRAPSALCFTFAVAINAIILLRPAWQATAWLVPFLGACGFIWLNVAGLLYARYARTGVSGKALLSGLGLEGDNKPFIPSGWNWLAYVPFVVVSFPGWVSAIVASFFVMVVLRFAKRGKLGLAQVSVGVIVTGCVFAIIALVDPLWISPSCGLISLVALIVAAVETPGPSSVARCFVLVESYAASSALIGLIPLAVVDVNPPIVMAVMLLAGVVIPAGSLLVVHWIREHYIAECRRCTASLRPSLQAAEDALKACEQEVRESDGLWRVCEPRYSSADSLAVGEYGYISWPEHDNVCFPGRDGGWCVARAITSATNPLVTVEDNIGMCVRRSIAETASNIAQFIGDSTLVDFVERAFLPWHCRVFEGCNEMEYVKMPWESGEVMAVPVRFNRSVMYPLGCGVVDSDGLPCDVRAVKVEITIKTDVVQAFREAFSGAGRPVRMSPDRLRLVREFVWRAPLIVPAVYEGILRRVVEEFRKEKTLGDSVKQASLISAINGELCKAIGPDVAALVDASVTSLDVVSAVPDEDRDLGRQVSEAEKRDLVNRRTHLQQVIMNGSRNYGEASFDGKTVLISAINKLISSNMDGQNKLLEAVAGNKVVSSTGGPRDAIIAKFGAFEIEVRRELDSLVKDLDRIEQAFTG